MHGALDPVKATVFVPVKNEMGFLPAFLAHYRSIGFEQFLVYDDNSDDGTTEYLTEQPDCVVVHATLNYGDELIAHIAGKRKRMRYGTYSKIALPQHFFDDAFVAYFDADEFLLLPPGVTSIGPVLERLMAQGATSPLTSVVEFFPETLESLKGALPQDLQGLLTAYPYFQVEAVVDPDEEVGLHGKRTFPNPSKTMRLFDSCDVRPRIERRGFERIFMSRRKKESQMFQRSARHKTPLVLRNADSFATSCHDAHPAPPPDVMLTIAHFVFTSQFAQKIKNARKWRAHAGGSAKYRYYDELLDKMQALGGSFLDSSSQKYTGPEQLIAAGLMRW